MEGFSFQANGLKERENDPCAVAAVGDSISIALYSFKTQDRGTARFKYLVVWVSVLIKERRKRGKGMKCDRLMVSKANVYC